MTTDIEVLKVQKLNLQKGKQYFEKESDEINQKDVSDEKEYDERDHISKMMKKSCRMIQNY